MKIATKRLLAVIGGVAITSIVMTSCDDYLDVNPQGGITESEISSNPAAAENLVAGLYNSLWDGNIHGFSYIGMTNIASDDADKGSNPDDAANTQGRLDNLSMDASVGSLNDVWSGHYKAIARANQVLDKLPLSPADEQTKKQLEGEVRFLRAYYYFNLVRFFGGVPLISEVPPLEELNNTAFQTRASEEEIYNFIMSDLQFAVDNLPIKGQISTGRATKGAAMGVLAKVYLYQQNWQGAYDLTNAIINGEAGMYDLMQNYAEIWRESGNNSEESMFEVQTGVNAACNAAINNYVQSQGPRAGGARGWADLGWGFSTPSESLLNAYEAGDVRRDATIIFIQPSPQGTVLWDGFRVPSRDSVENDRYNYKAYHSRTAEQFCGSTDNLPKNLKILRFGEVLLIHAEAAFALGNAGDALEDINRLRARAGLEPLQSVTREGIWNERRVELAMEHDRFFDLVRQEEVQPGRAVQAFAEHGKTFVKNKNEVFPIPNTQIQLSNGALTQNPGY